MASKWLPLGGVALLLLLVSAAGSPADARRGGGHGGGHGGHGGHSFSGARSFSGAGNFGSARSYSRSTRGPVSFGNRLQLRSNSVRPYAGFGQRQRYHQGHVSGHRHGHSRRHRRAIVGVPIIYGGYYYYYGDCDWLRRRAFATGSPYWWDRYYACVYEGGY